MANEDTLELCWLDMNGSSTSRVYDLILKLL